MTPDIVISVRFFPASEGGRTTDVSGEFYACPLLIDDKGFDCRLLLKGNTLKLGSEYDVHVKLLNRDQALSVIKIGTEVFLWEGKNVAKATVKKILE